MGDLIVLTGFSFLFSGLFGLLAVGIILAFISKHLEIKKEHREVAGVGEKKMSGVEKGFFDCIQQRAPVSFLSALIIMPVCFGILSAFGTWQAQHKINYEAAGEAVLFARDSEEHMQAMQAILKKKNINSIEDAVVYKMKGVVREAENVLLKNISGQIGAVDSSMISADRKQDMLKIKDLNALLSYDK